MGLDMYLGIKKYLSSDDPGYDLVVKGMGLTREQITRNGRDNPSFVSVSSVVCYWRKANAIHGWFVDNVMDGKDECEEHYVSRDQLNQLLDLAIKAREHYKMGDTDQASELLAPRGGFFFGSTDTDDNYLYDLDLTITQLQKVLNQKEFDRFDFFYLPSW